MALFGGIRDINLFTTINRELLWDIIEQKIGYYKVDLAKTPSNIYGESDSKFYHPPVLLNCLISRREQETQSDSFGPDMNRIIAYAFLKEDLIDANVVPENGDIIFWTGNYYEVEAIVRNQPIVGKDPDYSLATSTNSFGTDFSIICYTHWARPDKLNISQTRL